MFLTYYYYYDRLQDELEYYKEEISHLKSQMFVQEVEVRGKVVHSYEELLKKRDTEHKHKLEATKESLKTQYEARVSVFVTFLNYLRSQ